MLQKRNELLMVLLMATTCFLCGCTQNDPVINNTPTNGPAISEAATPTPDIKTSESDSKTESVITGTPTPTPTATPSPTPTPSPIPTVPPAPVSVNTDTTTIDFLVNRDYPLTSAYKPKELVAPDIPFSFSDKNLDKRKLSKVAADALEELYHAALEEEGLTIYGVSGYRSYNRQYEIYGTSLINRSIRHTNLYSAAPGNSEHQTGLAIDVSCKSVNFALETSFASTPEGIWLKENCWRFGFILRYPKDKEHITGYAYEPWHIRYVGIPLAYYLYTNNLTLDEYYGSPSSHTLEELEDTPLIDMTTEKFYKLYASVKGGELLYKKDGSIWVSEVTKLPLLKQYICDAKGKVIRVNGSAFALEPIYDQNGNYVLDAKGNLLYTKPYFDIDGNLWLDYNGSPIYLQPLWNADGTLATDSQGNILYTEPEKDLFGMEVVTEDGSLYQKVPVRDIFGELTFYADGKVVFYEPFIDPLTGELIVDSSTGLPLYPAEYYEVPHNTFPLPESYFNNDSFFDEPVPEDSTDDWFTEPMPEDTFDDTFIEPAPEQDSDTTDETGGFVG